MVLPDNNINDNNQRSMILQTLLNRIMKVFSSLFAPWVIVSLMRIDRLSGARKLFYYMHCSTVLLFYYCSTIVQLCAFSYVLVSVCAFLISTFLFLF